MSTKNFDDLAVLANGQEIQMAGPDGKTRPVTYKELIVGAVGWRFEDDNRTSPADLYKRGKLADKLDLGGDVNLTIEEMAVIKTCVAKYPYLPRVVARLHDLIEADHGKDV